MRKAEKYGDLKPRSKEYNRAAYFCKRYNLAYEEYATNPEKYTRLVKGRVKYKCGTKEYKKAHYILSTYGLTEDEIRVILNTQNNKCAICKININMNICHIDHCHETHKVRGLLCRMCNLGLGHFLDNRDSLKSAIDYLDKSER